MRTSYHAPTCDFAQQQPDRAVGALTVQRGIMAKQFNLAAVATYGKPSAKNVEQLCQVTF